MQVLRQRGSRLAELGRSFPVLMGSALGTALGVALYPLYLLPLLGVILERAHGWQWTDWAVVLTFTTVAVHVGTLLSGRIVDVFGPRRPAVLSTVLMGLTLTAAPLAHTLGEWRIGCVVFAIVGLGSGPVGYARAVSDAFTRARGLALGVTFGSIGLAGAVVPSSLIALAGRYGTQQALRLEGLGYIFVLAPLIALLLRRAQTPPPASASRLADILAPEIVGLARRWRSRPPARLSPVAADPSAGRSSLARSSWVALTLGFAMLLTSAYGTAVSIPDLVAHGRSGSPVALMAAVSLAVMVSRPVSGVLMDFVPAQIIAALVAVATGAGLLVIATTSHWLLLGVVLTATSLGAEVNILAFLVSRYAAPQRQSRIFARILFLVNGSLTLSPILFAKARALAGGYPPVLEAAGVAALVAAVLIGTLPAYERPSLPTGADRIGS